MHIRRAALTLLVSGGWMVGVGCEKREPPPPVDSPTPVDSVAAPPARPSSGSWPAEFGDLLVVPSDSEQLAIVVYPDTASGFDIVASRLVLLGARGDTVARGVTAQARDSLQCGDAPVVRLSGAGAQSWLVGLQGAHPALVPAQHVETLPSTDSARVVARLARLASALTAQQESRFNGLPFAVVSGRRFEVGDRRVLLAHLVRRLPQEAAPLEERLLLITESGRTDTNAVVVHSQRSAGSEETASHFEVLAVLRAGKTILVLLARDQMARTDYQVLERSPAGQWRVRWTRPLAC